MSLLSNYQKRMVKVILKNGGSIDKFMGDGIFAHFGAAKKTNTYAADSLRAVDELKKEITIWNKEREEKGLNSLNFGISVVVGNVMFGAVGDDSRLEYTTIGDPVNLCAKLEKHTKTLNVLALTTKKSMHVAVQQGYLKEDHFFESLDKSSVDGLKKEIDLVVLYKGCEEKEDLDKGLVAWNPSLSEYLI